MKEVLIFAGIIAAWFFSAGMAFAPHGCFHLNETGLSGRGQKKRQISGRERRKTNDGFRRPIVGAVIAHLPFRSTFQLLKKNASIGPAAVKGEVL